MFTTNKPSLKRWLAIAASCLALAACGGGGSSGGGSAVNNSEAPQQPPSTNGGLSYVDAESLLPIITAVAIPDDGRPQVSFQLTDDSLIAITDLNAADLRWALAKLQASPIGGLTGNWQSYINAIEQPGVGPGTESKLQASTEAGSSGELTNYADGTYLYRFAASVVVSDTEILAQAASEALNLSYEASRTHRVAIQFSGHAETANPTFDWNPTTGIANSQSHYDVVATENCNSCHGELAMHGGGRVETRYCVTCHNPGSSDANSGNSINFKQLIHKLHRGKNLPSVVAGGEYAIWGYGDNKNDYSTIGFPRDIRDCQICHAGTATSSGSETLTRQGDNWAEYASQAACGSCHDDLDFDLHYGGQLDDTNCMSCHANSGVAGSIASRHQTAASNRTAFATRILTIANSAPGQAPIVNFEIVNPENDDSRYDILSDPQWTGSAAGLSMKMAWATTDYRNTGNQGDNTSSVSIGSLSDASANGDGTFSINSSFAVPDGTAHPNIAANGSGAIVIEARADVGGDKVPLIDVVDYFSIDEADAQAVARRDVVGNQQCLTCHGTLSQHGGNRNDNVASCVSCHNPGNTDISKRASATTPPTDGKDEQSIDFKIMIHAIHGAAMRENPLQVVGFGGSVHVFDSETIHYPGQLSDCSSCHAGDSYTLPMADSVQATTVDTGADVQDPSDDIVVSRTSSVCSSCHDDASAQAHMESNGGNFATSQAAIDAGTVIEQCSICHGEGRSQAVSVKHGL